MSDDEATPGERLMRAVALLGVPAVLVVVLVLSFSLELSPGGRMALVFAGGAGAALALIAPWLLSRRRP